MQRRTFVTASAASLAFPSLMAQTLPSGPIRILVGFAPGGGTDILARVMGQKLGAMWNTTVVVENRAGATGTIAADYVAHQPGDGATLFMAHINSQAIAPALMKLNYNAETDFQPIALVGVTPNLLICNESQPAKTVKDLVELCKKNPGKISFGSAGNGSAQHLALEMFKLAAGITATAATPHVKNGKAIAIAQTRQSRAKGHPNVPTMSESGFPGFEATTWYGLVGPAKMPVAMAKRMNEDINKVLAMPDVIEKFEQYGAEDGGGSTEKFASFMQVEARKWAKVVKDANV
ncbi:MAG: LacI family transcriptional regulator, partial [Polaromonas sp. 39-63-203]